MPFACSICEQESKRICVCCTKDACDNHICERCGCCSDCCECDLAMIEAEDERARRAVAEAEANAPEVEPVRAVENGQPGTAAQPETTGQPAATVQPESPDQAFSASADLPREPFEPPAS